MRIELDTHCHTIASGHAYSTLKEYIEEAKVKNLQLIAITEHAPKLPGAPVELYFTNFKAIPKVVSGVEILMGVELNILDISGEVDLSQKMLSKMDIVIASFHYPCFKPKSLEENTEAVLNVMKNEYVNVIGHLGDPRYPIDVDKIVKAAKETNTFIEVNNSSFNPESIRAGGEETVLALIKKCVELNHPIIMGSDAHFYTALGDMSNILPLIEKANVPEELILNTSVGLFKAAMGKNK